jgi:hypothetical protein
MSSRATAGNDHTPVMSIPGFDYTVAQPRLAAAQPSGGYPDPCKRGPAPNDKPSSSLALPGNSDVSVCSR